MRLLLAILASAAACIRSTAVLCEDGSTCAPGTTCDVVHHQCLTDDQLESCRGMPDGTTCPLTSEAGVCTDGLCLAVICGDGIVQGAEQCDGAPPETSCIDQGFEAGYLDCGALCAATFSACRRIGWKPARLTGAGGVRALAGVGAVGFAARDADVFRYRAGVWETMIVPGNGGLISSIYAAADDRAFLVSEDGLFVFDGTVWGVDPVAGSNIARGLVVGSGPDDVYAFADQRAFRFDGNTWSPMPWTPLGPATSAWAGQSGVWVVSNGALQRWSGSAWEPRAAPMGTVDSVVGFGTVLVVAGHTGATAIVGRWDGAAWTTRDVTAELDAVMSPVLRVSGRNESDLDAFYLGGSVLLHFDGATWQRAAILPPIYAAAPIGTSMVVGTASDVYRESTTSYVDVSTTLPATAGLGVVGVWGATCTDVDLVLAGVSITDSSRIVHFDGSRWVTALDRPLTTITGLSGSSDSAVYAVTYNGDVLRRTAGVWSTIQNLPAQLRGVAAVPGVVTVFGDNGAVFTSSGGAWQNHPRPSDTITGAWVNGVNDVYVVRTGGGSSGVARWDGTAWNDEALPPYPYRNLQAIWGDGNGGLIAVGGHGEALHREAGVWRVDSTMPYDEYRAVGGASSNDVFAVGRFGTVAHWDGAHWAPVRVDVSNPRSVWTTDRCTYFGGEYSMPSLHRMERRDPWQ